MSSQQKFGPQSAEIWKQLAYRCTKDSMKNLNHGLIENGGARLGPRQAAIIEAMLYACIVSAYHNVAEEAVNGVDVTGALHAGDVERPGSATGPTTQTVNMQTDSQTASASPSSLHPACLVTCSECNWTNVSLLNLGDPGKPRRVCHGCCKRAIEAVDAYRAAVSPNDQAEPLPAKTP